MRPGRNFQIHFNREFRFYQGAFGWGAFGLWGGAFGGFGGGNDVARILVNTKIEYWFQFYKQTLF